MIQALLWCHREVNCGVTGFPMPTSSSQRAVEGSNPQGVDVTPSRQKGDCLPGCNGIAHLAEGSYPTFPDRMGVLDVSRVYLGNASRETGGGLATHSVMHNYLGSRSTYQPLGTSWYPTFLGGHAPHRQAIKWACRGKWTPRCSHDPTRSTLASSTRGSSPGSSEMRGKRCKAVP